MRPELPSAEALATVPNLTTAQQIEVRKILVERRDAHEAAAAKSRAERDALAKKDRAEHERIDDQSTDRLRKLLGDDGYPPVRRMATGTPSGSWRCRTRPGGQGSPRHGPHQPGPARSPQCRAQRRRPGRLMHALDQQWCRALGNYSAPAHGAVDAAFNGLTIRQIEEKSRWRAGQGVRAIRIWRGSNGGERWLRYARLARQVWSQVWAA